MKGQAINIDWSIGLTLFLFTSLSSLFLLGSTDFGTGEGLRSTASNIQEDLIFEASTEATRNNLTAQTPGDIENIPIDRVFYTENIVDWATDEPIYINSSTDRFVSVLDTGSSFSFSYFSENITFSTTKSNLQTSDSWINNSIISIRLFNSGWNIKKSGKTFFESVSMSGNDRVRKEKLFSETFSGDLSVYNSSDEIIIKDQGVSISAGNYTDIYWYPDSNEKLVDGYSDKRDTRGFSVSNSSHSATFTGRMSARVEKTGSSTEIEINSSKLKIRVHDSGNSYGEERITASAEGAIFLGAGEEIEILSRKKIEELENMTEEEFQEELRLENTGYRIEISGSETYLMKGEEIPSLTDAVVLNRNTRMITENGSIENVDIEVGVWR